MKQKVFFLSVVCYLSQANKSPEKFIIAVYLDRRNQHYVKRLRAQRVDRWNGKQINQLGEKTTLFVPYLYLCTLYLVLDIFIVTVVVCDPLQVLSSLNQPTHVQNAQII